MISEEFIKTAANTLKEKSAQSEQNAQELRRLQAKYVAQGKSNKEAMSLALRDYNQSRQPK